jgi:phospholipid transport system substrate-binding protein
MKKMILGFLGAALIAASAQAGTAKPPDQVVQDATMQLQELLHKNDAKYRADSKLYYKVVNDVVVPHFDVRYIAQLVMGRNWKAANQQQRTRFQNAFKDMLIHSYANALLEYHDSVKADWKPLHMAPDANDVTVYSNLVREGKPPIPIGFSMRLANDEWKIYDITIENISLVINFRGQINDEIKKNGVDETITRMESGEYAAKAKVNSSAAPKS